MLVSAPDETWCEETSWPGWVLTVRAWSQELRVLMQRRTCVVHATRERVLRVNRSCELESVVRRERVEPAMQQELSRMQGRLHA